MTINLSEKVEEEEGRGREERRGKEEVRELGGYRKGRNRGGGQKVRGQ